MREKLTGDARREAMAGLACWREVAGRDAITRTFELADFSEAWGLMSRIALAAEAMGHHPEWSNVYGRVEIVLTTHDAAGLTQRDITLARRIDALAGASSAR